jgi:nondiscriminating aspartyl-tRNA synthetase
VNYGEAETLLERCLAGELAHYPGQAVRLQGWVHRVRRIGAVTFVLLRDRSGIVQVVLTSDGACGAALDEVAVEDVIEVRGRVRLDGRAQGGLEVDGESMTVIAHATDLPFEINLPVLKVGLDLALQHRVPALRHARQQAIFRLKGEIIRCFREFSAAQGMVEVQTPKIVATATEGGANLFAVDYLGRRAYLAQSPQFYKQLLVLAGFERVFEVGPVYRAEPHNTSRHLNEFTSMDWEIGFVATAEELMALEERMLYQTAETLAANSAGWLAAVGANPAACLPDGGIARIPLADAQRMLAAKHGKELPPGDLDPEGERLLCGMTGGAAFVTDWPVETRPAYAKPNADQPHLTDSFDLLLGGIEVTTGGLRISDYCQLKQALISRGLNPEAFGFYLDGFRYGAPPHGGLAIGAERLTMALLGLSNMREVTLFPRDRERLAP